MENISSDQFKTPYLSEGLAELEQLGLKADSICQMDESILQVVAKILKELLEKNLAYQTEGGIFLNLGENSKFGELSGQAMEERLSSSSNQQKGARAPFDFLLFKITDQADPVGWNLTYGRGIVAPALLAVSRRQKLHRVIRLGSSNEVHPFHDQELLLDGLVNPQKPVKFWLHTGQITLNHMDRSRMLADTYYLRDLLKKHPVWAIRQYLLRHGYRHPFVYQPAEIAAVEKSSGKLNRFLKNEQMHDETIDTLVESGLADLEKDLNIGAFMGKLHKIRKLTQKQESPTLSPTKTHETLRKLPRILMEGLL
jgi:cysteinyl-tRNA synthetase